MPQGYDRDLDPRLSHASSGTQLPGAYGWPPQGSAAQCPERGQGWILVQWDNLVLPWYYQGITRL